ncbi:hypothetical protein [Pseudomonas sp. 9Ag]|uniref:hypothetical protein n=1 Tax=Pseudomonas sp. 9Ag TaxID=2653167 RepID=UPI0012EF869E|nr:hypothetical protein [Pseudomonas sp. 9Ag]VXC65663.1 hypothetical protein PSEUDO9AG_40613 [Pseudomonas sp. 9Ag]
MPTRQPNPADGSADDAWWNDVLRQALEDIGAAQQRYPDLFPQGISKVELQFEAKPNLHVKMLVEGPQGSQAATTTGLEPDDQAQHFESILQPASLLTSASPAEGKSTNQAKLKAAKTLEGAAKLFEPACKGEVSSYANNCAHYLSDALIDAGFSDLSSAHACVTHRCGTPDCTSGGKRPTRAKDMRCWFLEKDGSPVSSVQRGTGFYAVYQERQSDGQGHVVILDSGTWKFYGTGWYEAGQAAPNDWKHEYFQW